MIADNVGDNVGDCAGMAADLFETYVVTVVATMLLGFIFFTGAARETAMMLPLLIGGVCIFASVVGTYFVRLGSSNNIMGALYKGLVVTGVLSAGLIWGVINQTIGFKAPLPDVTAPEWHCGDHRHQGLFVLLARRPRRHCWG